MQRYLISRYTLSCSLSYSLPAWPSACRVGTESVKLLIMIRAPKTRMAASLVTELTPHRRKLAIGPTSPQPLKWTKDEFA